MPATDHLKPLFNARLLGEAIKASPMTPDAEQHQIAANWAASAARFGVLQQVLGLFVPMSMQPGSSARMKRMPGRAAVGLSSTSQSGHRAG